MLWISSLNNNKIKHFEQILARWDRGNICEVPNEFLSFQSIYKWSITFLCIRSTNHKFLNGWEFPRPFFLPLKIKNCSTNLLISIYKLFHPLQLVDVCISYLERMLFDQEGGVTWKNQIQAPPPLKPLSLQVNTQPAHVIIRQCERTYPPPLIRPLPGQHT